MLQLCVCRDIEHLGSLESTQEARVARGATLTPLSCSPNFPRAQYLDIRTLTHELIVFPMQVYVNDQRIEQVKETVFLGLVLNKHPSWKLLKTHIS